MVNTRSRAVAWFTRQHTSVRYLVLAYKNGIIAHFVRDQALGPVGGRLLMNSSCLGCAARRSDKVGCRLDRRVDRQIEPDLLGQHGSQRHISAPSRLRMPARVVHRP